MLSVPLNDSVWHQRAALQQAICDLQAADRRIQPHLLALFTRAMASIFGRRSWMPQTLCRASLDGTSTQLASRADAAWLRGYEQSAPLLMLWVGLQPVRSWYSSSRRAWESSLVSPSSISP